MPKRSGGYQDSSDESDNGIGGPLSYAGQQPTYAPPRLPAPGPPKPAFQLPRLGPTSSSQGATFRSFAPSNLASGRDSANSERLVSQDATGESENRGLGPMSRTGPDSTNPTHHRSNLALERQINTLSSSQEDYRRSNDEQHQRTDDKLNRILDIILEMSQSCNLGESLAPRSASRSLTPLDLSGLEPKSYLANPVPTPELIAVISKKKGGSDNNSLKEHVRVTWNRMLGIFSAKGVQPYFEDEYGEPDTLPSNITDKTDCLGPNISPLIQVNNTQGPERALKHATYPIRRTNTHPPPQWAIQNGSNYLARHEEEQGRDRPYASNRTEVPEGPEWEYLSHPGYTSPDESDDDGQLITKRPEYRAQWETNLFEAIRVAEHEKAKSRPGLCPRFPTRRVEMTRRPVPQLERGTGTNKVVVCIALSGISKSWREANPHEFTKYAPLINTKAATKPDIGTFLAKYPMPNPSDSAETIDLDLDDNNGQDTNGVIASPAIQDSSQQEQPCGDSKQGGIARQVGTGDITEVRLDGQLVIAEDPALPDVGATAGPMPPNQENFPINPQLSLGIPRTDSPHTSQSTQLDSALQPVLHAPMDVDAGRLFKVGAETSKPADRGMADPAPDVTYPPGYGLGYSDMPPPPPLVAASDLVPIDVEPEDVQPSRKRTRLTAQLDTDLTNPPTVLQPKKRGRPAGSKNKKKVAEP
ncbi:hypothetical protein RhiJN_10691 [Ceratobasidium sp. AG-Ba]|nr:hypothetical protein RhiJN_10691 [Ceratobasidium sp. AG-Ba]